MECKGVPRECLGGGKGEARGMWERKGVPGSDRKGEGCVRERKEEEGSARAIEGVLGIRNKRLPGKSRKTKH